MSECRTWFVDLETYESGDSLLALTCSCGDSFLDYSEYKDEDWDEPPISRLSEDQIYEFWEDHVRRKVGEGVVTCDVEPVTATTGETASSATGSSGTGG